MKIKNERKVRALCKAGHKIEATRVLRDSNPSMGLSESRAWIDREYPAPTPPPEPESREKRLEKNLQQLLDFLGTMPNGWLARVSADIGLLNEAYIEARKLGMRIR